MSRLGRRPIPLPAKVRVAVAGTSLTAEGPAGRGQVTLPPEVSARVEDNLRIVIAAEGRTARHRALWGTWRSHVANLLEGVAQGYEIVLEITGVGYAAKVQGDTLVMTLGYSHPVEIALPQGLTVTCPSPTSVAIRGVDKRLVGEFAAEVRRRRPAEPYNLKGIKYKGEVVRRKAGKTFVTGAT